MRQHNYQVFADYHQFYLVDAQSPADFSAVWNEASVAAMVVTIPGGVGVGTARNMTVPVTLELHEQEPAVEPGSDRLNECQLQVPSGQLVLFGPADYLPEAPRLEVAPRTYAVRIYYFGLNTLSPDGLDGEDHYKLVLWPLV